MHQLPNCISWRPDPGDWAVDAFSINWSKVYNYCFWPFGIMLKFPQKVQQEKPQVVVAVPFCKKQNWFLLPLGMLVDRLLIMTFLLRNMCLPIYSKIPYPLRLKSRVLVIDISTEILKKTVNSLLLWHVVH